MLQRLRRHHHHHHHHFQLLQLQQTQRLRLRLLKHLLQRLRRQLPVPLLPQQHFLRLQLLLLMQLNQQL